MNGRLEETPTSAAQRNGTAGRDLPADVEAEESVLGAALLDRGALAAVRTLAPGDFYKPLHQWIAGALASMPDDVVDAVTVHDALSRAGVTDVTVADLSALYASTPSLGLVPRHVDIVRTLARQRRAVHLGSDISRAAWEGDFDAVARAVAALGDHVTNPGAIEWADMSAVLADDLTPETPTIMPRTDGAALIYPGRLHVVQAEPEAGKTWFGIVAAADVLDDAGDVVIFDYEDTAHAYATRFLAAGVSPDIIRDSVHYHHPEPGDRWADLVAAVAAIGPRLVIIDGVAEALAQHDLDEDRSGDYTAWTDRFPRPITSTGAAVLLLDHVVKSKDNGRRYARGTGAKLAVIDGAAYSLHSSGFNRTTPGDIIVTVQKDRPGGLVARRGQEIARLHLYPHDTVAGPRTDITTHVPDPPREPIDKDAERTRAAAALHDDLAADVIAVADERAGTGPLSKRQVAAAVRNRRKKRGARGFDDKHLDPVLDDLVTSGQLATSAGRAGHPAYGIAPTQPALPDGATR